MRRFFKAALTAFYGLVMIEVLIMISPFAFYWYSLYAPTLQGLHHWRATAWLEAFFLPHSVITTSPFLEFLRWRVGTYGFSLGIIGFLICAAQVYVAKLRKKGIVHSWIYGRIRHPQYLFLSIAGFGLLTLWPRIIILVFYVGMLFAYYFLSRFEEREEEAKHPEYAEYRKRTAMFIPGNPGGKLFRLFLGWIPNAALARPVAGVAITSIVLGSAVLLRGYTIEHSAAKFIPENRTLAISIWPMPSEKIAQVVSLALGDERVRSALNKEGEATFTAHVLPENYGMVNMFADVGTDHHMFSHLSPHRFKYLLSFVFPFLERDLKTRIMGNPQDNYKVVFSRVDEPGRPTPPLSDATDLSAKMTPVVIAEVGANAPSDAPRLRNVVIPPRRSFWGDITMPMF